MSSINKVILIGNVGKDPEIRVNADQSKMVSFSLATTESWKDKKTGEKKENTEWHKIAVFNDRIVEIVEKYVKKGSKLYVEGQLKTRKWLDQSGVERFSTEIVLSQFRGEISLLSSREETKVDEHVLNDEIAW